MKITNVSKPKKVPFGTLKQGEFFIAEFLHPLQKGDDPETLYQVSLHPRERTNIISVISGCRSYCSETVEVLPVVIDEIRYHTR